MNTGNIGVGKSTLLNLCRSDEFFEEHFKIYCEPIEKWQNVVGKGRFNILDEFYKDSKGKAYVVVSQILTSSAPLIAYCLGMTRTALSVR